MFLPSGLAYYNQMPSSLIPPYSPLVFSFKLKSQKSRDHDGDGILSINEVNPTIPNQKPKNYDSDGDGKPNYLDVDDDGDNFMTKGTAVFGLLENKNTLDRAVEQLKTRGFSSTDISALFADANGTSDFAHQKNTKAPEGATVGLGTGAALGGALGWLVGVGSLAIPGVGPFIAAGPIMAALAGASIGGAVGTLGGALIGMGLPEYEAKLYESKLNGGRVLVSVHCSDSDAVKDAKEVLANCHAEDISSSSIATAPERKRDFVDAPKDRTNGTSSTRYSGDSTSPRHSSETSSRVVM
jgi:hypothetical protein